MANVLDRYFEEASLRIPTQPVLADKDLPRPEYPEHEGFELTDRNDVGVTK